LSRICWGGIARITSRRIPIPRETYDSLSDRARRLFGLEAVGASEETQHELRPEEFYPAD
jgi:hypothetical protein